MPVPKKDGSVRIYGDYKVTINTMLQVDQYPLSNPSELLVSLTGGQHFFRLDLTSAYHLMLLDDDSARLVTLNTHKRLYDCTRLPFGIASPPAIFQCTVVAILQGIPNTACYLDDISVTMKCEADHQQHLEEVLCRLQEKGVHLHHDKCRFFQSSV